MIFLYNYYQKIYFFYNFNFFKVIKILFLNMGIGPNPQSPIPNPQSPIPNPHFKNIFFYIKINKIKLK